MALPVYFCCALCCYFLWEPVVPRSLASSVASVRAGRHDAHHYWKNKIHVYTHIHTYHFFMCHLCPPCCTVNVCSQRSLTTLSSFLPPPLAHFLPLAADTHTHSHLPSSSTVTQHPTPPTPPYPPADSDVSHDLVTKTHQTGCSAEDEAPSLQQQQQQP